MRISGSIPTHIARAYGVAAPAAPAVERRRPPGLEPPAASPPPVPAKIQALIGGTVDRPVDFASGPDRAAGVSALPLYTRAADRIEAATGVQLGRAVDVRG